SLIELQRIGGNFTHLLFDEDYRLLLSKNLHEHCTNQAFKDQFLRIQGQRITLPSKFLPSPELLEKHREIMSKAE
ncbi:MAG: hypothetical protein MJ025_04860, partial [Victivallaceae bacterium]|nr:hypothetical protein [Victivallaceae bacterium]